MTTVAEREKAAWTLDSYLSVHKFSVDECYLIGRLSQQPTLAAGLDALYRQNPRRWHQVIAAAAIARR